MKVVTVDIKSFNFPASEIISDVISSSIESNKFDNWDNKLVDILIVSFVEFVIISIDLYIFSPNL